MFLRPKINHGIEKLTYKGELEYLKPTVFMDFASDDNDKRNDGPVLDTQHQNTVQRSYLANIVNTARLRFIFEILLLLLLD